MKDELTIKKQGDKYEIDGVTYVREEPKYDRQLCLQGKYDPPVGTRYFVVLGAEITGPFLCHVNIDFEVGRKRGYAYFPTLALAEEYILIAKGEWLPKKGDMIWDLDKKTLFAFNRPYEIEVDEILTDHLLFFPSESQRSTYIASQRRLPTAPELESLWLNDKSYNRLRIFAATDDSKTCEYLIACFKSRFIANAIREKEEPRDVARFYVFSGNSKHEVSVRHRDTRIVGAEYFSSYEGAALYLEAMGDSIQHLTS